MMTSGLEHATRRVRLPPTVMGFLVVLCTAARSEEPPEPKKPAVAQITRWEGDCKVFKHKDREFIVGVHGEAVNAWPLIGSRKMKEAVYAEAVFPMTIESQDSFVIYDKTRKTLIVYNIAVCCRGKDTSNEEKTDWVGEIKPCQEHWTGDILVFRRYDRKGLPIRAPYYAMGRNFPLRVTADGDCVSQYNYFGNVTFVLTSREVSAEMLARIVDDFDKHYHPPSEDR